MYTRRKPRARKDNLGSIPPAASPSRHLLHTGGGSLALFCKHQPKSPTVHQFGRLTTPDASSSYLCGLSSQTGVFVSHLPECHGPSHLRIPLQSFLSLDSTSLPLH
ncbi:hypothetical protein HYQ45_005352 [Verticillium longisporum]|uniref:Uncharacterized protein n=1 Tax=Verticillium longisporum TaxID=100787 RepID=A0A8I3ATK8_VERLO|nr:hypothetical protein HYQ45_005352 [Verticillium longisporum]